MTDDDGSATLMSALVTEHFALQSAASSTISESGTRAALYMSALSSGLVAIGFASSNAAVLQSLAFTAFPTVFLLGVFTTVRLVDTSVENIVSQRRIALIRKYYATLHPSAPVFFGPVKSKEGVLGVRYRTWSILFTMASMIIVVNSILAGASVALISDFALHIALAPSVVVGVVMGAVVLLLSLEYERRRLSPLIMAADLQLEHGPSD